MAIVRATVADRSRKGINDKHGAKPVNYVNQRVPVDQCFRLDTSSMLVQYILYVQRILNNYISFSLCVSLAYQVRGGLLRSFRSP